MTRRARNLAAGALGWLLLSASAWAQQTAPSGAKVDPAVLKRDTARCRQSNLEACYDALRWNPSDPALLVALGDALVAVNRPADAIRSYHRAAALAPNTRDLAAKISAAEAKLRTRHAAAAPEKRYSNAAPEAQSH